MGKLSLINRILILVAIVLAVVNGALIYNRFFRYEIRPVFIGIRVDGVYEKGKDSPAYYSRPTPASSGSVGVATATSPSPSL